MEAAVHHHFNEHGHCDKCWCYYSREPTEKGYKDPNTENPNAVRKEAGGGKKYKNIMKVHNK